MSKSLCTWEFLLSFGDVCCDRSDSEALRRNRTTSIAWSQRAIAYLLDDERAIPTERFAIAYLLRWWAIAYLLGWWAIAYLLRWWAIAYLLGWWAIAYLLGWWAIPTERFAIAYLLGLWESDSYGALRYRYRVYSQCFYYIISKGYRFSVGVLIMGLTKFAVGVERFLWGDYLRSLWSDLLFLMEKLQLIKLWIIWFSWN